MMALQGVEPERLTLAKVDPDQLDFFTLRERIGELERGRPAKPTKRAPACGTRFPGRCRRC